MLDSCANAGFGGMVFESGRVRCCAGRPAASAAGFDTLLTAFQQLNFSSSLGNLRGHQERGTHPQDSEGPVGGAARDQSIQTRDSLHSWFTTRHYRPTANGRQPTTNRRQLTAFCCRTGANCPQSTVKRRVRLGRGCLWAIAKSHCPYRTDGILRKNYSQHQSFCGKHSQSCTTKYPPEKANPAMAG